MFLGVNVERSNKRARSMEIDTRNRFVHSNDVKIRFVSLRKAHRQRQRMFCE
jgi:hypothetical protein